MLKIKQQFLLQLVFILKSLLVASQDEILGARVVGDSQITILRHIQNSTNFNLNTTVGLHKKRSFPTQSIANNS